MSRPGDYERILNGLDPTEQILWSGRPGGGIRLKRGDAIAGLVVATFLCLAAVVALSQGEYPPVIFIGVFLLALLYRLVVASLVDAWRRRRTVYALTNRRAIVVDGLFARRTQSCPLQSLPALTFREGSNGRGTIFCSGATGYCYRKNRRGQPIPRPLFRLIVDVRHVRDLMLDARSRLQAPGMSSR